MSKKPVTAIRKPSAVAPAAADAFVSGAPAAAPAAAVAAPKPAAKPQGGRSRRTLSVADSERCNAYVPVATMTDVRMRCASERLSLSEAVSEALAMWLAGPTLPVPPTLVPSTPAAAKSNATEAKRSGKRARKTAARAHVETPSNVEPVGLAS